MNNINTTLRATALGAWLSAAAGIVAAQPPAAAVPATMGTFSLNIAAQAVGDALNAFAAQTGLQVVLYSDQLGGARAPAVVGEYTPDDALSRILAATSLKARFIDERTVAILAASAGGEAPTVEEGRAGADRTRASTLGLALARSGAAGTTNTGDEAQAPAGPGSNAQSAEDSRQDQKGIPEMLVKGQRSLNADIRRSEDDAQPYVVYEAGEIQRSMAGNLEQFLKTRLPMNTVGETNSQDAGGQFGNQSTVNLRGLGANQTLILLNGRRLPGIFNGVTGAFNQPDINGIPVDAVERIEVLPSTASGIYGGGATGGSVNIILKREYSGITIKASYGNTFDSDAGQRRLEASAGFSLEDGKTNVMLIASYADSNPLLVGERDFARRGRALLYENDRAQLFSTSPPRGATTNIASLSGGPLRLDNGTVDGISLGFNHTFVPYGYAGLASDGGAALIANAGNLNLDLPDDLTGRQQTLLNSPTIESAALNLRREFGASVEAFVDLSIYNNEGRGRNAGVPGLLTLFGSSPANPFLDPVRIVFPTPGLGFDVNSFSETRQAAAGVIVRLPRRWSLQGDVNWSRARLEYDSVSPAINSAGNAALQAGTLDVLRDLNAYPLDFSPYLLPAPNFFFGPVDTQLRSTALRLAGPLARLPAGPLTLSVLLERREEEVQRSFIDTISPSSGEFVDPLYYPSRAQTVRSLYMETLVPLVSADAQIPLVHELQLQVSARHDEYQTVTVPDDVLQVPSRDGPFQAVERATNEVSSTDFTLGLRYTPLPGLLLRASYGTGFLPPSIEQVFRIEDPNGFVLVLDPKRGGAFTYLDPLLTYRGGNPNLKPEQSESFSAGAVLTPAAVPGLRLAVDYTRIRKSDEIGALSFQQVIDNEDALPGRVGRGPLSMDDELLGYTAGEITSFDFTMANLSNTEVEAWDVQIDYAWEMAVGTFSAYAVGTYQPSFKRQLLESSPVVQIGGFSGDSALKLRVNGGLTLDRGPWSLGWSFQYYDDYIAYPGDASTATMTRIRNGQGSDTIPSQIYHDLFARYRFDAAAATAGGLLADMELTLGVQNVFDTSPPILATTGAFGGYSVYGDPRLRAYSVAVVKRF